MTEALKGKTRAEFESLLEKFQESVTGDPEVEIGLDELGELAALAGVRQYPTRVKCATLPWHTLKSGLEGSKQTASTE